jgi:dienelactone hydrolase
MKTQVPETLSGTIPLDWTGDISRKMLDNLHGYFDTLTANSVAKRASFWERDLSSPQAYTASVRHNRERLARLIGLADQRQPVKMLQIHPVGESCLLATSIDYTVCQVQWQVLEGVTGEGLLLSPLNEIKAQVIALPDADQTPEQLCGLATGINPGSQYARRLAALGIQVLIPTLINRDCQFSSSAALGQTNQSHREWIYRQAFEIGRHIIGLEVQKVLSAIDWFLSLDPELPVGVAGYGEGGLIAFYSSAIDERIQAVWVSGYFRSRQELWKEPIDRNIWGLLREFGDAEIVSLIAPRALVVEHSDLPMVNYSPPMDIYGGPGTVAAPGLLSTPSFAEVEAEFTRIESLIGKHLQSRSLFAGPGGLPLPFGSDGALTKFAAELGIVKQLETTGQPIKLLESLPDPNRRQENQIRQLEQFIQNLLHECDLARQKSFLSKVRLDSIDHYLEDAKSLRQALWEELIGKLDEPQPDANPRSRLVYNMEKWIGYEIVLDVWKDVFAWGILCIPRDLQPGETRPVVVCQHGYEGLPHDTIEDTEDGLRYYRRFSARLAERGFITFAPHNPYRLAYRHKQLHRKANPLKASLGSVIIAQHTQIVHWLASLPFVDPLRIAFYGLSYGGWTAVRIPPIIGEYCLSICSATLNDWIRKVTSLQFGNSYMGDASFEMCEWDAGQTFSNAEMASLMAPRPFMVERGMHDIVAPDAWVASEYAKVHWLYTQLGIPDRIKIEFFNGEHSIHGQRTFDFLHEHLNCPRPEEKGSS